MTKKNKKRGYKRPDDVPSKSEDPKAYGRWYQSLYTKEPDMNEKRTKWHAEWVERNKEKNDAYQKAYHKRRNIALKQARREIKEEYARNTIQDD